MPVRQRCQVLGVAPAAYCAWRHGRQRLSAESAWQVAVREAFAQHSQRYGTRRRRVAVQAQGHAVGRWRIRRVLQAHGLRAPQAVVPTFDAPWPEFKNKNPRRCYRRGFFQKSHARIYTHLLSNEAPFTSILLAEITKLNTIEAWVSPPRASKLSA